MAEMTPTETAAILRQFNEWRRLEDDALPYSEVEIGEAIDAAVEMIERLEAAEKDSAHHKALAESALRVAKGWEDKCDALRAKIERMDEAMESLLIRCDDSDSAMYGTLSTSFVRDTVRIARGALEESK